MHLTGRCPSCGHSVQLAQEPAGLVIVHQRLTRPEDRHQLVWTEA